MAAKSTIKQLRQGDVLLIPCGKQKETGTPIEPRGGKLILAEGEATGHHHSVDASCAQLFQVDQKMLLVVGEPTEVQHQEHGAIEIGPGQYWVVRQNEYTPQAVRRVSD